MKGFIYLHRKILENPVVCKDADHIAVWVYLLLNATHDKYDTFFNGKRITLTKGQLITGRNSISEKIKVNPSKVQRILKKFETEQQIEQQTSNKNRLITVSNWENYQYNEQLDKQQVNNKRTTTEQQVNTNNNVYNVNNEIIKKIVFYLNEKAGANFKHTSSKTVKLINSRLNDGFFLNDFIKVIDIKTGEWLNTEMSKYLRPETLFGTKFESYLNQKVGGRDERAKKDNKYADGEDIAKRAGILSF